MTEITAFISYSWDNDGHKEWVRKLCSILRGNGINALLDSYEVFAGSNLEEFMKQSLSSSKYIVCICSDGYVTKMDDPATGVGKENEIIQRNNLSDHVIPLVRGNLSKKLPDAFSEKYYVNFNDNNLNVNDPGDVESVMDLLKRMNNIDHALKPSIGQNPFKGTLGNEIVLKMTVSKSMYATPELSGRIEFDYSNNDGSFTIGTGDFSFTTQWSKASDRSIYAYRDAENIQCIALVKNMEILPNQLPDTSAFDFSSRVRSPGVNEAIMWLNRNGHFAVTKILTIKDCSRNDTHDWVEFEYKIYLAEQPLSVS